ncbi:S9 family peptidase [Aquincola sp. S2]|uniref:Acyl-peptide hydrolase n=1 Tax=Pseudaquabacterium terrae TaxID=2732868 RepID=A0ABX2E9V4_9BURK|nr:S9 family peptidase [Aquabacterium terrae]NRF65573.1 S9 family peptidase [Aquabacterium terrae]
MRKPITVEDLWQFERLAGVVVSPDGTRAVCGVTQPSMERNDSSTQLWLLDTDAKRAPRPLTSGGQKNGQAAWSPRGDRIAFVARREQQGRSDDQPQLYLIAPDGGEATRASDFAPGIEAFRWLPDGRGVVFAAWVWPGLKGARAQAKAFKTFNARKETGYATSEAHYRLFDHQHPMQRVLHLLRLDLASGRIVDLFEGTPYELPRVDLQPLPFDVSADGRHLCFAYDPAPEKLAGQRRVLVELDLARRRFHRVADDPAWDFDLPRYSPQGERIAALAANVGKAHTMPAKPALLSRDGRWRALGAGWDLECASAPAWSVDARALYFSGESRGRCPLWRCAVDDDVITEHAGGGWVQGFDVGGAPGQEVLVTAIDGHSHPVRLFAQRAGAAPRRIERFNDRLLARLALGEVREVSFQGALGDEVQMWLTLPPDFDARRRHPVLHVIHGGPQVAAGDSFGYRWNAHLLASQGHVVAQVNYHGSTSFGHAFKHSIVGRLAELEFQDLEAATDWLRAQRWVDPQRISASGGSYGGFLVAWMNGHAAPGRYRAYVCHAGVFDRVATFAADSYAERPKDLGALYWDDMPKVLAQSPHAFAAAMRTPTLVIHGALDYRVPDCNGLAFYNTLKLRGVPARLLWFPDENHWVLKPRNSRQWYREFFTWLDAHSGRRRAGRQSRHAR